MKGFLDRLLLLIQKVNISIVSGLMVIRQFLIRFHILLKFMDIRILHILPDEKNMFILREDLKRTKQLVRYNVAFNKSVSSINDMSNNRGEVKWLRPIHADEIAANPGITEQNPGY